MKNTIAIIDYGSGNLHSAAKAVQHIAPDNTIISVTDDYKDIAKAGHIILPGVGAFADCMAGLSALDGMIDTLNEYVLEKQTPFLGICVGMQLLAKTGYEHGETKGLGWIDAEVVQIKPSDSSCKIPHMGWNTLDFAQPRHPIAHKLIHEDNHMYFVHSYHMRCADPQNIIATTDHGETLTAIVGKDNITGVQFHPEKSQTCGMQILENLLNM